MIDCSVPSVINTLQSPKFILSFIKLISCILRHVKFMAYQQFSGLCFNIFYLINYSLNPSQKLFIILNKSSNNKSFNPL